jgi:CBS domain-containing protein
MFYTGGALAVKVEDDLKVGSRMLVHDVMSAAPITLTPLMSLNDLLTLFDRHDYNAFPVLGPDGRLVGIVTKLDVLRVIVTPPAKQWVQDERTCAADIMQRNVVSVQAEDSLVDAGNLMIVTKLRSVPVADGRHDGRKLLGMLSRGDVLRGFRSGAEQATGAREKEGTMSARRWAVLSRDAGYDRELEGVETLIDQMGEQSFPASDPPAWGVIRARLDLAREKPSPEHRDLMAPS